LSLEVKEEVSAIIFYKDVGTLDAKESVDIAPDFQAVSSAVSPNSINVDIEGIHSVVTRNYTYYTPDCLKKSIPYWTSPYEKPVIMHHNDKDGIQIGRIKCVEYLEKSRAGMPGLLFTVNIGDEAGIKGVKNGTLSTVSLGAIIHKATCSICGQNIASEGECEHKRGRYYDDKLCYWIMEDMEPKELSYVIVPSDKYANTVKIYKPKNINSKESYSEGDDDKPMANMFDNLDLSMAQPEEVVESQEAAKEEEVQEEQKAEEAVVEAEVVEEPEKEEAEPEVQKEEEVKEEEVKEEAKEEDKSKEELLDLVKKQAKMIADLQDDIKYLKDKLDKERGMKESLELELLEVRKVNKMHLAEQVIELRKELGLKEEAMDELMMLSEESLNSSIKTFMEFKESTTFNVSKLPQIKSDALVSEEQDNTVKEITESVNNQSNSNIDYEQEIDDWFKKMTHRKYFN
jgi:hypothetical protein